MNNTELSTTLATQINEAYAAYCGYDEGIRRGIIGKCNKARDLGILLESFKSDCAHGNWKLLFTVPGKNVSTSIFAFSYEAGRYFRRYAEANPNPIISLADGINSVYEAMIFSGAIAAPKGHGEQQRTALSWLDKLSLGFGKVRELFNGRIEKVGGDVALIPAPERQALKLQLEPMVELYGKL